MSKFFETKMAAIGTNINRLTMISKEAKVDFDKYYEVRKMLNTDIIELVFGATITTKGKIKFNHSIPSAVELNQLYQLFNEFYEDVEDPLLDMFYDEFADRNDAENMEMFADNGIPVFDKVRVKSTKMAILEGGDKQPVSMLNLLFSPAGLVSMAALAESTRKVLRRNQILIIAGIVLTVAAATTAGICIYNHNKKREEDEEVVESTDDDYGSAEEIDDAPVVDLELA